MDSSDHRREDIPAPPNSAFLRAEEEKGEGRRRISNQVSVMMRKENEMIISLVLSNSEYRLFLMISSTLLPNVG